MVEPGGIQGTLLDACCILNLFAVGPVDEILQANSLRFGVARAVADETLFIRRGGSGEDANEREPVDLGQLVASPL
jgi:hypothetical protein